MRLCGLARICLAIGIVLMGLQGSCLAAASSPDQAETIRRDAAEAARSLGLQTKLPFDLAPREEPAPARQANPPRIAPGVAYLLFWIAIIILVCIVCAVFKDHLWSHSRARRLEATDEPDGDASSIAERMEQAKDTADELADAGDFAEAMHLLLLRSLGEMRRRLNITIANSLTSREILARIAISGDGKTAFGDIVRRVEISRFGTYRPGLDDYLACRASYNALTAALGSGS